MYDGKKNLEVVELEVPTHEFEKMIEFDYQERLRKADSDEVVARRTPQAILDEMNFAEINSWRRHNEKLDYRTNHIEDSEGEEFNTSIIDLISDSSQAQTILYKEDHEAICQWLHQELKPDQAEMIIAITLNETRIKDYALKLGTTPKQITDRLSYAKKLLRERSFKVRNE